MTCVICGEGELLPQLRSSLFERDDRAVVIRHVPSLVCSNCGEVYHEDNVTASLLGLAEQALEQAGEVMIEEYRAA